MDAIAGTLLLPCGKLYVTSLDALHAVFWRYATACLMPSTLIWVLYEFNMGSMSPSIKPEQQLDVIPLDFCFVHFLDVPCTAPKIVKVGGGTNNFRRDYLYAGDVVILHNPVRGND